MPTAKSSPALSGGAEIILNPLRLRQVLWVTCAAAAIGMTFGLADSWYGNVAMMQYAFFLLTLLSLWFSYSNKPRYAIITFTSSLTLMACSLTWYVGGIHDETITFFPGVLMFVGMFGTRRQYLALLGFILLFIVALGTAFFQGWYSPGVPATNQASFVNVGLSLLATGLFIWVVTNDLQQALTKLRTSETQLRELNELLEFRVIQRTEQLEAANGALQESMAKLEHTQAELMEYEKLASLGSMVAGISHEMNTPVGNALLAATSLQSLFEQMLQDASEGNVKRTQFNEFLETGRDMSVLVTKSTQRAADTIISFKQVAVDQTSEQRRNFDLRNVVEDNLAAFSPTIRGRKIIVGNAIPQGIQCDSFPGPLGQVVTNLLQNAVLHGFDGRDSGTISITGQNLNDRLILTLSDDGHGMESQVIAHVFDPFFTTKLGKGGSGLGLTISHRLVTSVLGGTIAVTSGKGTGTTFTITIPKIAPFPI